MSEYFSGDKCIFLGLSRGFTRLTVGCFNISIKLEELVHLKTFNSSLKSLEDEDKIPILKDISIEIKMVVYRGGLQ